MSDPFAPLAQAAIDAVHASLGVPAAYVSAAGSATVLVIPKQPDALIDGFGGRPAKAETALFEVRTSEVPAPAPDDTITIGYDTWRVRSVRVPDGRRLTVLLDCVPVLVTDDAHGWPDGDRAAWPGGDGWAWAYPSWADFAAAKSGYDRVAAQERWLITQLDDRLDAPILFDGTSDATHYIHVDAQGFRITTSASYTPAIKSTASHTIIERADAQVSAVSPNATIHFPSDACIATRCRVRSTTGGRSFVARSAEARLRPSSIPASPRPRRRPAGASRGPCSMSSTAR